MHFSTATGSHGDRAFLESRLFYPKRGFQCLQFYLYNNGGASDRLNVWVREYNTANPKGELRLIQTLSGDLRNSWEIHHVTLDVSHKFRVVFEGVKGSDSSKGGLSLDDINLSETQCPHHTWRIRNFSSVLQTTPVGSRTSSPIFVSREGYSFQISLYVNGKSSSPDSMGIYFHLTSGPHDSQLKWPCPWRQLTMALMDQNPNIQHRMNNQRMITTDPSKTSNDEGEVEYFWDDPRKVGSLIKNPDGTSYYRGPGYGTSSFITHQRLKSRDFIKGDDLILFLSLEDISGLLETQPVPQSVACGEECLQSRKSASDSEITPDSAASSSSSSSYSTAIVVGCACAGVVTLLLVIASVLYRLKRLRQTEEADRVAIVDAEVVTI